MIILLTGQPGAGKTTLGRALQIMGEGRFAEVFRLDGDAWRFISQNRDYSEAGRRRNVSSAFVCALALDTPDRLVILSFVAPYRAQREQLRVLGNCLEVFLYTEKRTGRKALHVEYEPSHEDGRVINVCTDFSVENAVSCIFHHAMDKLDGLHTNSTNGEGI